MKATRSVIALLVLACTFTAGAQSVSKAVGSDVQLGTAREHLARWQVAAAERIFRQVLDSEPENAGALTGLGLVSVLRLDYATALGFLTRALEITEDDPETLAGMVWLYSRAEIPEQSRIAYRRLQRCVESREHAFQILARTPVDLRRFSDTDRFITTLNDRYPGTPSILTALAHIHARNGDERTCRERVHDALAIEPNHVPALELLVSLEAKKGRRGEAERLCVKILALDPCHIETRQALCQLRIERPVSSRALSDANRARLLKARGLIGDGRLQEARAPLRKVVESAPDHFEARILYGGLCLSLDRIAAALRFGRRAVKSHPEDMLGHLLLAQALLAKHHAERVRIGGKDWARRYAGRSSPEVKGVDELFPDYPWLTPTERRVVDNATYPARRFLHRLEAAGTLHAILPLYRRITDLPGFDHLEGKSTFDQRPWTSVRGASGRKAATGVETLWDTAHFGFSVVAHELGHQIFLYGLEFRQRWKVTDLFRRAVAKERTLDAYSKSSASEYFAQSYEAFVSRDKRPGLAPSMRHTRSELRAKDYPMFAFLSRITSGN